MKIIVIPTNYMITLKDSKDRLVGSTTITEVSPKTFLYSPKTSPSHFNAMYFEFNQKDMSITVNGVNTFKTQKEIELGADEHFGTFVFIDSNEIEPCVCLMQR